MHTWRALGVALLLTIVNPLQAEEPRAIVERGLKAMGGHVDPARNPAMFAKIIIKGKDLPVVVKGNVYLQSATTVRLEADVEFGGEKQQGVVVFDGKKGWAQFQGQIQDMPESEAPHVQAALRLISPNLLSILLADKSVKLSALPAGLVEGRTTFGVKAAFADKTEIDLHFDQENGLLLSKSAKIGPGMGEEAVIILSNYREQGVAEDVRVLNDAGIGTDGPRLLAFLRKQAPDPAKVAQAAALVKRFADDSFEVREKAVEEVVALGNVAVPHLERALKDRDAEVARRAKECLALIAKQNDSHVLEAAIRQVVWSKVDGGTEVLLKLLPGANTATAREVKSALALAVERDGKPDAALVKALKDADPVIRDAAVAVLGKDDGVWLKQPGRRLHVRGLKQPMTLKLLAAGNVVGELEIAEMQFFNEFEPKLFAKP